jgi:hypothetical protein
MCHSTNWKILDWTVNGNVLKTVRFIWTEFKRVCMLCGDPYDDSDLIHWNYINKDITISIMSSHEASKSNRLDQEFSRSVMTNRWKTAWMCYTPCSRKKYMVTSNKRILLISRHSMWQQSENYIFWKCQNNMARLWSNYQLFTQQRWFHDNTL